MAIDTLSLFHYDSIDDLYYAQRPKAISCDNRQGLTRRNADFMVHILHEVKNHLEEEEPSQISRLLRHIVHATYALAEASNPSSSLPADTEHAPPTQTSSTLTAEHSSMALSPLDTSSRNHAHRGLGGQSPVSVRRRLLNTPEISATSSAIELEAESQPAHVNTLKPQRKSHRRQIPKINHLSEGSSQALIALNQDFNVSSLAYVKHKTVEDLVKSGPFNIKVNNREGVAVFTKSEATYLVETFYAGVCSRVTLDKIAKALEQYRSSGQENHDQGVAERCFAAIHDADTPPVTASLLQTYGNIQTLSAINNPELNRLKQNLYRLKLASLYDQICAALDDKSSSFDPAVRDEFVRAGWGPSQGRGWKTRVLDFMEKKIMVARKELQARLDRSAGLYAACSVFGKGFAGMAFDSMDKLTEDFGVQKLRKAFPVILEHCRAITVVAAALEDNFLRAVELGLEPPPKQLSDTDDDTPLLARLLELNPAHSTLET